MKFKKVLGPGILFAATAIGVSHLIQSTSAGALFGLNMIPVILLANVLKYPFFEYGSRYAAATGTSIIEGYHKLHPIFLYLYLLITFVSMFFVVAAVGAVTVGFMENLFHLNEISGLSYLTHGVLFGSCTLLLLLGKFSLLDKLIKLLGIVLITTTLLAFVLTLVQGPASEVSLIPEWTNSATLFLIPLMGWMPTAVDLSAWNSLWTVEKMKETGYQPTVKESVAEFNFGYWISAGLAFVFLLMGAFLIYGTDIEIPKGGVPFSKFVIELYTQVIGKWSFIIIAAAAFSIMFSTFITVIDGYSRALTTSISLLSSQLKNKTNLLLKAFIFLTVVGGLTIILLFGNQPKSFGLLVKVATSISFLIAPLIAILNYRLVQSDQIGKANSPSTFKHILSWLGIIYLLGFSIYFLFTL